MKSQYVGDINDFAKYGLLKCLSGARSSTALRLGIMWYLTPDVLNGEGGRVGYLEIPRPNRYSAADPMLLHALEEIVRERRRDVGQIQRRGVLPNDTVFFQDVLTSSNRTEWFLAALEATRACELVFLDPDNGLATSKEHAPKRYHATLEEVATVYARGQSLACIQFLHRRATHADQLERWLDELSDLLPPGAARPFAMRWHGRGSYGSLGFLVVPAAQHARCLTARASDFVASPWGKFFDLIPSAS